MSRLIDVADAFSEYIRKTCTDALNNYAIQDGLRDEKVTPTIELEPYRVRRMTREEAVARIKDHIEIHRYHERNAVKIFEALDMAIKALEQPEIVRCKDCKHCTEHYDIDGNVPYWTCSEWDGGTDADGFCYMAERRTDG